MVRQLNHYPPNPAYGTGTFRRRIVLVRNGQRLTASLLDDFHEMEVDLTLGGDTIVDVAAHMERFPRTTCPGAVSTLLAALRGRRIDDRSAQIRGVDRGEQCTHLIDLAAVALSWGDTDGTRQVIEVALTDRDAQNRQSMQITVDGALALACEFQDETVIAPEAYRGRKLFGGFARWVDETFTPAEGRLWLIAQISVFVATGRVYIVDGPNPRRSTNEPHRRGACFTYSGAAFDVACDNIGYVRDMSSGLPPLSDADGMRKT